MFGFGRKRHFDQHLISGKIGDFILRRAPWKKKKKCHDIFQLKIFSPRHSCRFRAACLQVVGTILSRRFWFTIFFSKKVSKLKKKRRNKKILCTRLLLQSSPASWSRVTTLSSTIGLHPPPPPPAYYTQIMMVAHWKPVIAGFNPVASVYFIFLQLIFRQRPPVTWGGIVSKTGETKTNSTGFIYLFFLLLLLFRLLQDTKEKKERDTVKIEENVRDNYYISGDII